MNGRILSNIFESFEKSGLSALLRKAISVALKIQSDEVFLLGVTNTKNKDESANGVRVIFEIDYAVVAIALGVSTDDEEGVRDAVATAILTAIPSLIEKLATSDAFLKLLGYRNAAELRYAGIAFTPDDVSLGLRTENAGAIKVPANALSFSEPIYIGAGIGATLLAVLSAWAIRRRCRRRNGVAARTDSNAAIETDLSASSASSPVPSAQGTSVSLISAGGSQATVRAVHAMVKGTAADSNSAMAPVHEIGASPFNRSIRRAVQRRFSADVLLESSRPTDLSGGRSYSWGAASFFRTSHRSIRIEPLQPATTTNAPADTVPHVPIDATVSASADASIPFAASPGGSMASGAAPSARRSARSEMAVEVTPGEDQQRSRAFERFVVLSSARSKTSSRSGRSASASPKMSERAGIPSPQRADPPLSPLLHHRVEEPIAHAEQSTVELLASFPGVIHQ